MTALQQGTSFTAVDLVDSLIIPLANQCTEEPGNIARGNLQRSFALEGNKSMAADRNREFYTSELNAQIL
jgi:hypothetical protein